MKTELKIKGMHCPSCEVLIKEGVEELPGITSIKVDHKKGKAIVNYDESRTKLDAIKQAVQKEGYEVV